MFRCLVSDYLDKTKYKHWSIIAILQYLDSKQELSVDMLNDIKGDIYAVLQGYIKKENVNENAKKKVTKIFSAYEKSFSSTGLSQFRNKLRRRAEEEEHKTALRMKQASACTIEDLKELHANKHIINQLFGEGQEDISKSGDVVELVENDLNKSPDDESNNHKIMKILEKKQETTVKPTTHLRKDWSINALQIILKIGSSLAGQTYKRYWQAMPRRFPNLRNA